MSNSELDDLQISGFGSVPGGSYKSIKIFGRGKITGDVECDNFIINGSGELIGALVCKQLHINGFGQLEGDVGAEVLKIHGTGDFNGRIKADNVSISGSATGKNGLDAQTLKISGAAKINGNVNAESFSSTGRFEIDGLLNAENIDVHLDWSTSKAKEIGGETITVMNSAKGFSLISIVTLGTHNPHLEADLIEGDKIILENTTAKAVCGNHITIGDNCDIGIVEYKGSYHKSSNAKVGEEKKV